MYTSLQCNGREKREGLCGVARIGEGVLVVPATPSPSEKVWNVSARAMQAQKANIGEKLSSGIMFVKKNVRLLQKYYQQLVGNDNTALPLELKRVFLTLTMKTARTT